MNIIPPPPSQWEKSCLVRGERYRLLRTFSDADGLKHVIGEEWQFLSSMFSRYDNEYLLSVRLVSGGECRIRLRYEAGKEKEVIDRFHEFIERI
jgi:hypothetical protein